jgi:hypothetical protein
MGNLNPGDENLHHCDSSHRWTAPPDVDQDLWVAVVRDHLDEHRRTMGGPAQADGRRTGCSPFVPDAASRARRPAQRVRQPVGTLGKVIRIR